MSGLREMAMPGHKWTIVGACLLLGLLLSSSPPPAAAAFRNTLNRAFETRCNGPQGAIVVARKKGVGSSALAGARQAALRTQHSPAKLKRAVATYRKVQALKLRRHKGQVRFPRVMIETTAKGAMSKPNLAKARAAGKTIGAVTNNLTFTYEGWSATDQAALKAYLATAYPKAKLIYGPPAFNNTVNIVCDDTIDDVQGGVYNTATNEIRMPSLSGNFPEDSYILLLLVLHAFHDDALLYYDSWEQGLAGAAAYAIQTTSGVSPGYDIVDPGPFYCLSVYEPENQPELGNSTYYPASGATNMLVWRVAMARAAWQKCWIEDDSFFADFNTAYYANYSDALPGDIPTLKELAAGVLPRVENTPFAEWYEHQYALDTSVHTGYKLYTWNIPLPESVALICEYYQTLAGGDEEPQGGSATTIYWNYDRSSQLYAEEGNVITISSGGSSPGEGYLIPTFYNIGGAQRITVQADLEGLRRFYTYPYGERGFELSENNIYGSILAADTGTIDVDGGNDIADLAVKRGVWGSRVTTAELSPLQAVVSFTNDDGETVSRTLNIGWDSYVCTLESGVKTSATHTYAYGASGLHLMSLPLKPLQTDLATTLGIAASELLLAWWDPGLSGDNKYRLYPLFPTQGLGSAYWLRVPGDTAVNYTGLKADTTQEYEVALGAGWNLVGCPRLASVNLADLTVRQGDAEALSWSDAVDSRLVQDSLYGYSQAAGYQLKDALEPWQGYWVRVLSATGVTLIFPVESSGTSSQQQVSWR